VSECFIDPDGALWLTGEVPEDGVVALLPWIATFDVEDVANSLIVEIVRDDSAAEQFVLLVLGKAPGGA